MDQSQLSKLDPKLKEVYDKVMNAPVAPRREQTINPPTPPASPTTPPTSSSQNPVTQSGTSQVTINMPTPPPAPATKTSVHGFVASEQKKNGKIPVAAYVIVAVLFFIAYAIFWVFFFKIPIPFISQ